MWSKVQAAPATVAETQAYALAQIDAIVRKLEEQKGAAELAKALKQTEPKVREWLTVLARCFQLQDAIFVLELDRVLDSSPSELDAHRAGLSAARQDRRNVIHRSTGRLIERFDSAAATANAKVLLNPFDARQIIQASDASGADVVAFHKLIGIEGDRSLVEVRPWRQAVDQTKDMALATAAEGVNVGRRLAGQGMDRARSVKDRVPRVLPRRLGRGGQTSASDGGDE